MSQRTVFRNGVKHWLISSFNWDHNEAWSYVYGNIAFLDQLRFRGFSTYKAAEKIHHLWLTSSDEEQNVD